MAGHGRKNIDDGLVLALAGGASTAAAATQAGCSESTVRRRLAEADFRARVHAARSEMVAAAVGRLATLGTTAADELERLIQQGKDDNVKLGAARAILQHMLGGHEHATLVQLVGELRQKVEELERDTGHNQNRDPATGREDRGANADGDADVVPLAL